MGNVREITMFDHILSLKKEKNNVIHQSCGHLQDNHQVRQTTICDLKVNGCTLRENNSGILIFASLLSRVSDWGGGGGGGGGERFALVAALALAKC